MIRLITLFTLSLFPFFHTLNGEESANRIVTFAGGCFWCTQSDFDAVKGVVSTTVGYTGGSERNPTYYEVSSGKTGHVEAVQITFDPNVVSYEELLNIYFHNVDPTTNEGQFCDKGSQYRPIIFFHSENQKQLAEKYKQELEDSHRFPFVLVAIRPATAFYPAETYHQKYYKKNPVRYKYYRYSCGRDKRLKELW